LKPDDVPTLLARAQLHATRHEPAEALTADLEAADHAAPRGSEARVHLGDLYQYAGNMPAAVAQYNGWIDVHERQDVAMPRGLYRRGVAKQRKGPAGAGQADIDAAVARQPVVAPRAAKFGLTP